MLYLLFFLTGCNRTLTFPYQMVTQLTENSLLKLNIIPTKKFRILTYSRLENRTEPLRVYIEGDGQAWKNRFTPSRDPTPQYPIALALASRDNRANILYIARPCQYPNYTEDRSSCYPIHWTHQRFSSDIVTAINEVIDYYAHGRSISLIGYSGGAAIAVLIAANRLDVINIISVAGNLDTNLLDQYHRTTPLQGLNPKVVAKKVAKIPQYHFFGQKDQVIPPMLANTMLQAYQSSCMQSLFLKDVSHHQGWQAHWPMLLAQPLICR